MIHLLWLACTPAPQPPTPARAPIVLAAELQQQRSALARVETERLLEALEVAVAAGSPVAIAEVLVAGRRQSPDAFATAWTTFITELQTQQDSVEAARAAAILYEAADNAEDRRQWRSFATRTLARWRYSPDERARTLAEHVGITRPMAHKALDTLRSSYVDPADSDFLSPGIERLIDLDMLAAQPIVVDPTPAGVDAILDAAVAHGTPEPTAVAEFVEAVFGGRDEWTAPVWPAQVSAWKQHHDGVVQGVVGVVVDVDPEGIYIRQVVDRSPAWTAGVHADDRLTAVDGVAPASLDAAAQALRGPNETPVTLSLVRDSQPLSLTVTRGTVRETTVTGWKRSGPGWTVWARPGIGLIRIASFRPHTDTAFADLLPAPAALNGLILDLRGNSGGDLDVALSIADRFIGTGRLVDVETRLDLERPETWGLAVPGSPWEDVPLVVLVDRQTASSAEILAGALQSQGATVIGEQTTGKGTGQLLRVDEELGFAMQFTHLRWRLPDGTPLHRTDEATVWGIQPDHPITIGATESFVLAVLRERREALAVHVDGTPMPYRGPEVDESLPTLAQDPLVELAVQYLPQRPIAGVKGTD